MENGDFLQANGISIETAPTNELTGSMNNLVSGQRSPRIESLNGELRVTARCPPEDIIKYPRQYINETYLTRYPSRLTTLAPQDRFKSEQFRETDKLNADLKKYSYTCDENIQKYPQRCREEYHRCSDNNLIYDQFSIERKFAVDLQKYPARYSEDTLRGYRDDNNVDDDDEPNNTNDHYIDLRKFPQRYRDDPNTKFSNPQHTLKYNNLRCAQHPPKYPITKNILPARLLGSGGGIPIIGQTAISLVVNRFGSAPLSHEMAFAENSLCPNDATEEDLLNRRFIIGSISDNDDI